MPPILGPQQLAIQQQNLSPGINALVQTAAASRRARGANDTSSLANILSLVNTGLGIVGTGANILNNRQITNSTVARNEASAQASLAQQQRIQQLTPFEVTGQILENRGAEISNQKNSADAATAEYAAIAAEQKFKRTNRQQALSAALLTGQEVSKSLDERNAFDVTNTLIESQKIVSETQNPEDAYNFIKSPRGQALKNVNPSAYQQLGRLAATGANQADDGRRLEQLQILGVEGITEAAVEDANAVQSRNESRVANRTASQPTIPGFQTENEYQASEFDRLNSITNDPKATLSSLDRRNAPIIQRSTKDLEFAEATRRENESVVSRLESTREILNRIPENLLGSDRASELKRKYIQNKSVLSASDRQLAKDLNDLDSIGVEGLKSSLKIISGSRLTGGEANTEKEFQRLQNATVGSGRSKKALDDFLNRFEEIVVSRSEESEFIERTNEAFGSTRHLTKLHRQFRKAKESGSVETVEQFFSELSKPALDRDPNFLPPPISTRTGGDVLQVSSQVTSELKQGGSFDDAGGRLPNNFSDDVLPILVKRVIGAESNGNPEAIGPDVGKGRGTAKGAMQLLDSTGKELHSRLNLPGEYDPLDQEQNVFLGTAYLTELTERYDGDVRLGLAAYNAGLGNVDKAVKEAEENIGRSDFEAAKLYLPKYIKEQKTFPYIEKIMGEGEAVEVAQTAPVELPEQRGGVGVIQAQAQPVEQQLTEPQPGDTVPVSGVPTEQDFTGEEVARFNQAKVGILPPANEFAEFAIKQGLGSSVDTIRNNFNRVAEGTGAFAEAVREDPDGAFAVFLSQAGFGAGDELAAGAGSALENLPLEFFEGNADFQNSLQVIRQAGDAFTEQNPGSATALSVAGSFLGPAGFIKSIQKAQGVARKAIQGLKVGTAQGAAFGAGNSRADTITGRASDAIVPAVVGGATGLGLPLAGKFSIGIKNQAVKTLGPTGAAALGGALTNAIFAEEDVPVINRLLSGGLAGAAIQRGAIPTTKAATSFARKFISDPAAREATVGNMLRSLRDERGSVGQIFDAGGVLTSRGKKKVQERVANMLDESGVDAELAQKMLSNLDEAATFNQPLSLIDEVVDVSPQVSNQIRALSNFSGASTKAAAKRTFREGEQRKFVFDTLSDISETQGIVASADDFAKVVGTARDNLRKSVINPGKTIYKRAFDKGEAVSPEVTSALEHPLVKAVTEEIRTSSEKTMIAIRNQSIPGADTRLGDLPNNHYKFLHTVKRRLQKLASESDSDVARTIKNDAIDPLMDAVYTENPLLKKADDFYGEGMGAVNNLRKNQIKVLDSLAKNDADGAVDKLFQLQPEEITGLFNTLGPGYEEGFKSGLKSGLLRQAQKAAPAEAIESGRKPNIAARIVKDVRYEAIIETILGPDDAAEVFKRLNISSKISRGNQALNPGSSTVGNLSGLAQSNSDQAVDLATTAVTRGPAAAATQAIGGLAAKAKDAFRRIDPELDEALVETFLDNSQSREALEAAIPILEQIAASRKLQSQVLDTTTSAGINTSSVLSSK